MGSFSSSRPARSARRLAKNRRSTNQMRPVSRVSPTRTFSNHAIMPAPFCRPLGRSLLVVDLQDGEERLLGNFHATHLLHPLLALFLLLEELLLAGGIAAVALGQHVLAQRLDRAARDDLRAHGG